ncbi:predicted protein [Naegleria gruberi]|uniref:Predicted protein n=1 Tax=Naegleria gruberi TaxID=5762 RepID=D2VJB1_NAEGR|nr:uncharacterized protein NAEGRDRAFT_50015 [Naegleria gruberi]EFC43166.1 predicted protein [Naegleria gruberi]|eukprot:XP_002675910.1 predicted protein [Naegleria gruberi strain NEG-M]
MSSPQNQDNPNLHQEDQHMDQQQPQQTGNQLNVPTTHPPNYGNSAQHLNQPTFVPQSLPQSHPQNFPFGFPYMNPYYPPTPGFGAYYPSYPSYPPQHFRSPLEMKKRKLDEKDKSLFLEHDEVDSTLSSVEEDTPQVVNNERSFLLSFIKEKGLTISEDINDITDIALTYIVENAYVNKFLSDPKFKELMHEGLMKYSTSLKICIPTLDLSLFNSRVVKILMESYDILERISVCIRKTTSCSSRLELTGLYHGITKMTKGYVLSSVIKSGNMDDGISLIEKIISYVNLDPFLSEDIDRERKSRLEVTTNQFMVSHMKTANNSNSKATGSKDNKTTSDKKNNKSVGKKPQNQPTFQK